MSDSTLRIGVTGAAGFIGRTLVAHLASRGHRVTAFSRRPPEHGTERVTWRRFDMSGDIQAADFAGLQVVVHGAVSEYGPHNRDSDRINREGTLRVAELCDEHGARLIYLSSLSAHPEAASHYGRSKLELENLLDAERTLILRLGLVLGDGGLFGNMVETLRSSRIVPLADGGQQPIQIVWMDDLMAVFDRVIGAGTTGRYDVATPHVSTIRDLNEAILRRLGLQRRFVSLPTVLLLTAVRVLETLRVPFPVRTENVLGLRHLKAFDTAPDLARLGVTLHTLETAVDRLLTDPSG